MKHTIYSKLETFPEVVILFVIKPTKDGLIFQLERHM